MMQAYVAIIKLFIKLKIQQHLKINVKNTDRSIIGPNWLNCSAVEGINHELRQEKVEILQPRYVIKQLGFLVIDWLLLRKCN